ncbi:translation elongation factor P [Slackia exigua ATCC 700122]|uniref:Elongation factor P n=2 Tax=Slackia TaxID=84108 RepID=D0WG04_SLAES|nr:translation elongation factor P [Slackia exigua ATCC 700122]STN99046.1 Elongation factor P [Slackia exigua]
MQVFQARAWRIGREQPMATISTADFKNGMCIVYNGKKCKIVEFQHVKPGKGSAFVRMKMRDIRNGRVLSDTVNAGFKFETVRLEQSTMQYLYNDGVDFYFMDPQSYEQISLPADQVGENAQWLKENDEVTLEYADGELLGVEPQMFVELTVADTEPGFKGDTVQGSTKPATLETGAEVKVPMYVNVGDVLQIDTRDGRFVKRM